VQTAAPRAPCAAAALTARRESAEQAETLDGANQYQLDPDEAAGRPQKLMVDAHKGLQVLRGSSRDVSSVIRAPAGARLARRVLPAPVGDAHGACFVRSLRTSRTCSRCS